MLYSQTQEMQKMPHTTMESRYNIHFAITQSFFSYIFSSCRRCCPLPAISTIEACFYVFERVHWQSDVNPSLLSDKNSPYRDISNPFSKRKKKKKLSFSSIFHFIFFFSLFFFLFHFSTHNVQNKSGRPGELQGKEVSVIFTIFRIALALSRIFISISFLFFQFYMLQCASVNILQKTAQQASGRFVFDEFLRHFPPIIVDQTFHLRLKRSAAMYTTTYFFA